MLRSKFERYLSIEKNYADQTLYMYLVALDNLHAFLKESYDLDLFDEAEVIHVDFRALRMWMRSLMQSGLSLRSIAQKVSASRTFFGFLRKTLLIDRNPAARLKVPKFEKKLPVFLKESEMEALLSEERFEATFEGQQARCILEVLYSCGLRSAELIHLLYADIDFNNRLLKVMGKRSKERIVPFGLHAKKAMQSYMQMADREGFHYKDRFLVSRKGTPIKKKEIYTIVKKHIRLVSSVSKQSPHVLRHTFATHLLNRGADLNAIKELLGHSSLASTQIYTHNTIQKLKSAHNLAHPRAKKKDII